LFFIESIGLENPTGSIPFRWPILTPSSDTRKALENKDRVSVAKGWGYGHFSQRLATEKWVFLLPLGFI
jgi:hypothetical protein